MKRRLGAPRSGRGRGARRSLAAGGTGVAGALNAQLGGWPRVRIAPLFGRWGYFVGPWLFACFPVRPKDTDLWIRLPTEDQQRALASAGITPHRRFAGRGWVECQVVTPRDVPRAVRWLRRGYAAAVNAVEREEREEREERQRR